MEDAWAAGLFDGEGHVQLKRNTPEQKARVLLRIGMKDKHSVQRWAAWAGAKVNGPYNETYYVTVPWKRAHEVMERMRPYLGVIKFAEWEAKSAAAGEVTTRGRAIA